jgi:hypothetical protein
MHLFPREWNATSRIIEWKRVLCCCQTPTCTYVLMLSAAGREEPNAHPLLPEPEGRETFSIFSPFGTLKAIVGPRIYNQLCSVICFMLLAACCWFMVPLVGAQVVGDLLGFGGDDNTLMAVVAEEEDSGR